MNLRSALALLALKMNDRVPGGHRQRGGEGLEGDHTGRLLQSHHAQLLVKAAGALLYLMFYTFSFLISYNLSPRPSCPSPPLPWSSPSRCDLSTILSSNVLRIPRHCPRNLAISSVSWRSTWETVFSYHYTWTTNIPS